MKKFSLFLLGILAGAIPTAFAASTLFSDLSESDWYYNAATSLQEKGIVEGYSDGTFGATNNVNRAELAVMLDRTISYLLEENDDNSSFDLHKIEVSDAIPTDSDGFAFTNDDFEDSYFVDGDNLYLTAGYGGGCSDHEFNLMWDGKFTDSSKTSMYIIHDANGEICNNYKTEMLKFNLKKVREIYAETYAVDSTYETPETLDLSIYTGIGKSTKIRFDYSLI